MLNCHPEITVPPECGFALWWYDKYRNWTYSPESWSAFLGDFTQSKKIENWHIDYEALADKVAVEKPAGYAELTDLIYRWYARSQGKDPVVWGDKNNFYVEYLEQLRTLFPEAGTIFVTRDGRDVACSYIELNQSAISSRYLPELPKDVESIASEWRRKNELLIDHCLQVGRQRCHRVRYEDLVRNPVRELREICLFLDIPYDSGMLDYQKDTSEPEDILQWKRKTKQALDTENIGKFRNGLSKTEIRRFNGVAGHLLEAFGYLN